MTLFRESRGMRPGGILRNERGILLISVAMIAIVAAAFVAVAATRTVEDAKATATRAVNMESLYAAHAGEQAMVAAIRRDALSRFAAAQAGWSGTGAILPNPQIFFTAQEVTLPGVRLPTGACFDTVTANIAFVNSQVSDTRQVYNFQYTITSRGTNPDDADLVTTVNSSGNFQLQIERQSFANYALFTNRHTITSGSRVWFTSNTNFTGPVHTNDRFALAFSPTFSNGLVSSVAGDAYYYNNGRPRLRNADHNAPYDVPMFGEGFQRGAPAITLPENAFDQKANTVGGPASTNAELRDSLGLPPGGTPPPDGIYYPNDGLSLTAGIFVQGNVNNMVVFVDGAGRQRYQIDHSNGATVDIIVDTARNETRINSVTYDGVPNGAVYVAGDVRSFGGPSRSGGVSPPAVASETSMSLFSEGDVVITRDIVYEDDPLTATDAKNVLGIFTPDGDIRIGGTAPDDVTIHSTLMTSDNYGVVQVDDYSSGSPRGTATILGGVISSYYGAFGTFNSRGHVSGYSRNFVYDQRLNGGIAPPYFPTTTIFMPATSNLNPMTWTAGKQNIPGASERFQTPSSEPYFYPNFS